MKPITLVYHVTSAIDATLPDDVVVVTVVKGSDAYMGGEGEFEDHIGSALQEWYDTSLVTLMK